MICGATVFYCSSVNTPSSLNKKISWFAYLPRSPNTTPKHIFGKTASLWFLHKRGGVFIIPIPRDKFITVFWWLSVHALEQDRVVLIRDKIDATDTFISSNSIQAETLSNHTIFTMAPAHFKMAVDERFQEKQQVLVHKLSGLKPILCWFPKNTPPRYRPPELAIA